MGGGRTAATPVGVLLGVVVAIACLVFVALVLVVLALVGTDVFA